MERTVSLESLMKAMQGAETRWQEEEAQEKAEPLTPEEIATLRRGELVTVVQWWHSLADLATMRYELRRTIQQGKVTAVKEYGFTDGRGFWCATPGVPQSAKDAFSLLVGRDAPTALVPCFRLCYKTERGSDVIRTTNPRTVQVYRGWAWEVPPVEKE